MHITIIYNTYIYLHTLILTSQNVSDMYSMMVVPPMRSLSLSLSHSLSLSLSLALLLLTSCLRMLKTLKMFSVFSVKQLCT